MVSEPRSREEARAGGETAEAGRDSVSTSARKRSAARDVGPGALAHEGFGPGQLHRSVSGDPSNPPILLLHGWGSSAANMESIERALAANYFVVNVDLPGHGFSPAPPAPMGIPEHAALVADFIRDVFDGPVTIVGHSNGGRISLYMASQDAYKDLVERMILISPSGVTPTRSFGYYFRRTVASILKAPFQLLPGRLREFGLDWLRHSLVWRALGSSDYRGLQGTMRATFVQTVTHHIDDDVRRIRVPTLLIWGDRDTAISREQMDYLDQNIPNAGLVVLENAGHYGYVDDFPTFIASARHFLQHS